MNRLRNYRIKLSNDARSTVTLMVKAKSAVLAEDIAERAVNDPKNEILFGPWKILLTEIVE